MALKIHLVLRPRSVLSTVRSVHPTMHRPTTHRPTLRIKFHRTRRTLPLRSTTRCQITTTSRFIDWHCASYSCSISLCLCLCLSRACRMRCNTCYSTASSILLPVASVVFHFVRRIMRDLHCFVLISLSLSLSLQYVRFTYCAVVSHNNGCIAWLWK
jgi:hypothetical protein